MKIVHLVFAVVAGVLSAGPVFADVLVADLRCEYLTEPLGIDTALPRFSWKLVDSAKTRGQRQTACQIIVESATGASAKKVLWDSGKVASSNSVNFEYGGTPLASGQDCFLDGEDWN